MMRAIFHRHIVFSSVRSRRPEQSWARAALVSPPYKPEEYSRDASDITIVIHDHKPMIPDTLRRRLARSNNPTIREKNVFRFQEVSRIRGVSDHFYTVYLTIAKFAKDRESPTT